jgi:hypothetical protein
MRDAQATFGHLRRSELNWRPDEKRWSVGQCFEHVLTANELMFRAARAGLTSPSDSIWQRIPVLPSFLGRALIRSQAPGGKGKYKAPAKATPATSAVPSDIVQRFVEQQRDVVAWTEALDEGQASRVNMCSPFLRAMAYSVMDGFRLMVAHDRRHFEQARRVMLLPEFPSRAR